MKFTTVLYAIYLMMLALVPCTDTHSELQSDQELSWHIADQDEHNHGDESCSPFCTCQCCSVHVTFETNYRPIAFQICLEDVIFPQAIGTPEQPDLTFWQPPKV